jgi:hypothetical protein
MDDVARNDARRLGGRIGGLTAWSRNGPETMVGPAHRGFRARFERLVDPDCLLEPSERALRTDRAIRAHMLSLASRSAASRRKRNRKGAPAVDKPGAPQETDGGSRRLPPAA